jgi:hypothetical protein
MKTAKVPIMPRTVEVDPLRTLLTVSLSKIWVRTVYAIKSLNINYLKKLDLKLNLSLFSKIWSI